MNRSVEAALHLRGIKCLPRSLAPLLAVLLSLQFSARCWAEVEAVAWSEVPSIGFLTTVGSPPAEQLGYRIGNAITISATFDQPVAVRPAPHGGDYPVIYLRVGSAQRRASYAGGSGTETLTFVYQVATGDLDEDGLSIGADSLDPNGGALLSRLGPDSRGPRPNSWAHFGQVVPGPGGQCNPKWRASPPAWPVGRITPTRCRVSEPRKPLAARWPTSMWGSIPC